MEKSERYRPQLQRRVLPYDGDGILLGKFAPLRDPLK